MKSLSRFVFSTLLIVGLSTIPASADPKVETTDIGLNGRAIGISISAGLKHVALLAQQGSRFSVYRDGTAGPRIAALCSTEGTNFNSGSSNGWVGQIPVLFDDTGEHWTYCYRDGSDTVIMLDGKEIGRGPMQPNLFLPLTFSRGGKFLAWGYDNQIFINGQPGPKSRYAPHLFFSPDGSRYAYVGQEVGGNTQWGFVDGKQVNYFGEIDQFSATNHLLSIYHDPNGQASIFVMDGKPEVKAAGIGKIWTSENGKEIAITITPTTGAKQILTVNGKIVPAAEGAGITNVFFSPDGKRYAANCVANNQRFMIIDGKKADTYDSIPEQIGPYNFNQVMWIDPSNPSLVLPRCPAFTSDSSKFAYLAGAANSYFLMTEDGEYDDFVAPNGGSMLAISPSGGHYGFLGISPNHKQAVVIDGKATIIGQPGGVGQTTLSSLSFSPDGSRYGVVVGFGNSTLYVDGKPMGGNITGQRFVFSPDSKHVLYVTGNSKVAMDDKIIQTDPPNQNISYPFFSPDSQHVYWIRTGRINNSTDSQQLYVDGKAATHLADFSLGHGLTIINSMTPDGVLTFISRTDNTLTRFVVTPDSNIDAMLAAAKPAPASN